jgi:lipoyl synthase
MVSRDDLFDGGAAHLVKTIREVRGLLPQSSVEVLSSDFGGSFESLDLVLCEKPEIFNHNVETVPSLSSHVRSKASFPLSLSILRYAKELFPHQVTKSGLMVGLGEKFHEVIETLSFLADAKVDIVTIGQYLQPTHGKLPVKEFIHPDTFLRYEEEAKKVGIPHVLSGPFVRSSFHAATFASHPLEKKI